MTPTTMWSGRGSVAAGELLAELLGAVEDAGGPAAVAEDVSF
jgi:hypothetical protein